MHTLKEAFEVLAIGAMLFILLYFSCVFLQRNLKQPIVQNLPAPMMEQLPQVMQLPAAPSSAPRQGLVPPPPPLPMTP